MSLVNISKKVKSIPPSATLAISAKAKKLIADGVDVVAFGVGEPDFDTPKNIKNAAIKAINEGFTNYPPVPGIPELREAIVEKFKSDNGLEYDTEQVIVSCGAKHVLYNIMQAICNPGDEVVVVAPYWVSYTEMIKLADAKPGIVKTTAGNGFSPTPEQINSAITDDTKAIIINSPSNPAGVIYDKDTLKSIGEIACENNIYIISDEIYEKLIYDGELHHSIAGLSEEFYERTITVNGVSKAYAMTGWRIGYAAAGDEQIIESISKIQSHSTSGANSIAQKAGLEALTGPQEEVEKMRVQFEKRRDLVVEKLNEIETVSYVQPKGAFYAFPDVSANYGRTLEGREINDSLDMADYLITHAEVAVVPGKPFGYDDCIRLSFATSMEKIETGLERIRDALL